MIDPVATPPPAASTPVTLEELLRLKRAEKPAPEFWTSFEAELRAKQLSALMGRPVWWRRLVPVSARFLRLPLPLGAAAALAVGAVVWRAQDAGSAPASFDAAPALAQSGDATDQPVEGAGETIASAALAISDPAGSEESAVQLASTPSLPATPWQVLGLADPAADISPSARTIAANLAAARSELPELLDALGRADRSLAASTRAQAMPVGQAAGSDDFRAQTASADASTLNPRAARLLAAVDFSEIEAGAGQPTRAGSTAVRDRAIRRLSDDALYDSASRLGVGGDRFSISF